MDQLKFNEIASKQVSGAIVPSSDVISKLIFSTLLLVLYFRSVFRLC